MTAGGVSTAVIMSKEQIIAKMKAVKRNVDFYGNLVQGGCEGSDDRANLEHQLDIWKKLVKYNKDNNLGITETDVEDYKPKPY